MSDYFQAEGLNSSLVKGAARSSWFEALAHKDDPPTASMAFGTAVHSAVLEPKEFMRTYTQAPVDDKRTKAYKEWAKSLPDGKIPLGRGDYQAVLEMAFSATDHPSFYRSLDSEGNEREKEVFTEDPEFGIVIKAKIDLVDH